MIDRGLDVLPQPPAQTCCSAPMTLFMRIGASQVGNWPQLSVSNGSAMAIIDALGYSKVCARWVPRRLATEHRRQRKAICSELLSVLMLRGAFCPGSSQVTKLGLTIMSWRRNGNEWSGVIRNHQEKKKFKTTPSAGKLMITVFLDIYGVILVDVVDRGETISSDAYIKPLQKLKQHYRRVRPNRNPGGMLIQHNNPSPRTSLRTREAITKFGWTVLPIHPIVLIWYRQISIFLGH